MRRYEVPDKAWVFIEALLPPTKSGKQGRPWDDHRKMLNGIFWVLCSGAAWRDIPERYGEWNSIYNRFKKWSDDGTLEKIFNKLLAHLDDKGLIDWELFCIDGTNIRASKSAAGALKKSEKMNLETMRLAAHKVASVPNSMW